jgi:hypothetical protein
MASFKNTWLMTTFLAGMAAMTGAVAQKKDPASDKVAEQKKTGGAGQSRIAA